jgi:hypothetical protein
MTGELEIFNSSVVFASSIVIATFVFLIFCNIISHKNPTNVIAGGECGKICADRRRYRLNNEV